MIELAKTLLGGLVVYFVWSYLFNDDNGVVRRWVRAWWHKITWDEHMDRPNRYADIMWNLFGQVVLVTLVVATFLGLSVAVKLWFGFMFGMAG